MNRLNQQLFKSIVICIVLLSALSAARPLASRASAQRSSQTVAGCDAVPGILARIKPPTFAARDFNITSYGAVAGGQTDATEAIRKAIGACHTAGGGRVVVPAGIFLTGAIHLKSNVNLYLAE